VRDPSTCRRCELGSLATQAVPGEGPRDARIVFVGEQPGDDEDLAGRPFVGPAGKLLREALACAGIDASAVYLTNAVKHFRFEPRGKRRIHKTPAQRHVDACRAWLDAELDGLRPAIIVALGTTAVYALTGWRGTLAEARGRPLASRGSAVVVATYHPAAVLRAPDAAARQAMRATLVDDLRSAAARAAPSS
jgi:DNA polymerase